MIFKIITQHRHITALIINYHMHVGQKSKPVYCCILCVLPKTFTSFGKYTAENLQLDRT